MSAVLLSSPLSCILSQLNRSLTRPRFGGSQDVLGLRGLSVGGLASPGILLGAAYVADFLMTVRWFGGRLNWGLGIPPGLSKMPYMLRMSSWMYTLRVSSWMYTLQVSPWLCGGSGVVPVRSWVPYVLLVSSRLFLLPMRSPKINHKRMSQFHMNRRL